MKNIEIKINHSALQELCFAFDIPFYPESSPESKVVRSIMIELTRKMLKKEIDKRQTVRKFKMSFKYYEAFALERFCRDIICSNNEITYLANVALSVANQIHKQL